MASPASCIFNQPALFQPELLTLRVRSHAAAGRCQCASRKRGRRRRTHSHTESRPGARCASSTSDGRGAKCFRMCRRHSVRRCSTLRFSIRIRGRRETMSAGLLAHTHGVVRTRGASAGPSWSIHAVGYAGCLSSHPVTEL